MGILNYPLSIINSPMRIALTADWLPTLGGAERVIAELHHIWPDAPIFTTVARRERLGPLTNADLRLSRLQIPFRILGTHTLLLPWMPRAMERFDLRDYDVILSSSHAVGKGIVPPSTAVHICYCHTPMRYAWEMEDQYLDDFRVPRRLRTMVRRELARIRRWDLTTADRVDRFIANSTTTQERIARIYGRESEVVHPPVDDRFFDVPLNGKKVSSYELRVHESHSQLATRNPQLETRNPQPSFLAVGRLVPYKRFDLLIEVANALHLPLTIAGDGSDAERLKAMAGPTVTFLGYVPEDDLPSLYASAQAFLFPPLEDAGVVPLEAQACGTPVIALGQGGAVDTVRNGVTGLFFLTQTAEALIETIRSFRPETFDQEVIREHARRFSEERFRKRMSEIVQEEAEGHGR